MVISLGCFLLMLVLDFNYYSMVCEWLCMFKSFTWSFHLQSYHQSTINTFSIKLLINHDIQLNQLIVLIILNHKLNITHKLYQSFSCIYTKAEFISWSILYRPISIIKSSHNRTCNLIIHRLNIIQRKITLLSFTPMIPLSSRVAFLSLKTHKTFLLSLLFVKKYDENA